MNVVMGRREFFVLFLELSAKFKMISKWKVKESRKPMILDHIDTHLVLPPNFIAQSAFVLKSLTTPKRTTFNIEV